MRNKKIHFTLIFHFLLSQSHPLMGLEGDCIQEGIVPPDDKEPCLSDGKRCDFLYCLRDPVFGNWIKLPYTCPGDGAYYYEAERKCKIYLTTITTALPTGHIEFFAEEDLYGIIVGVNDFPPDYCWNLPELLFEAFSSVRVITPGALFSFHEYLDCGPADLGYLVAPKGDTRTLGALNKRVKSMRYMYCPRPTTDIRMDSDQVSNFALNLTLIKPE